MPMTQSDIQTYYRDFWGKMNRAHADGSSDALVYSSPIEDATIYPIYEQLIADLGIKVNGGKVLDIGSGAGRWIRFILDRFAPESLLGVDFAESSVGLLNDWSASLSTPAKVSFMAGDITAPLCAIEGQYDFINIANVLFHIPEPEKFEQALHNIANLLAEGGRVVTTEYLPRTSMRTQWMAVRSRYEFQDACETAGLEICDIRACSFFSNDPMGIDGPDAATRKHFYTVKAMSDQLIKGLTTDDSRTFVTNLFAEIERATLAFCTERTAQIDMPAQKLVVLRKR
jgi:SAM-dependent methyltransferase